MIERVFYHEAMRSPYALALATLQILSEKNPEATYTIQDMPCLQPSHSPHHYHVEIVQRGPWFLSDKRVARVHVTRNLGTIHARLAVSFNHALISLADIDRAYRAMQN